MTLRKRIFSNNSDMTFGEYLVSKKGIEIIKSLKSQHQINFKTRDLKIEDYKINSYLSYNDFINLTKTFFSNSYKNATNCKAPQSINDSKTSFICYEKIKNHIKKCNYCNNNTINNVCDCKYVRNILYPYGNYSNNSTNLIFPYKIDLNKWCNECKLKNCNCEHSTTNDSDLDSNYTFNTNDENLIDHQDSNIYNNQYPKWYSPEINKDNYSDCNCDCIEINEINEINDNDKYNNKLSKKTIICNEYDDRYYTNMKNKIENINSGTYYKSAKNTNIKYCGICNKTTNLFI